MSLGNVSLYPDPPPKRKGGSGEYSTASHHGLAIAMDSAMDSGVARHCVRFFLFVCLFFVFFLVGGGGLGNAKRANSEAKRA